MSKETITRVYRETVGMFGAVGVSRQEAIESGVSTLMAEHRAGRLDVDVERYFRRRLVEADEKDGRNADTIMRRAAFGQVPLVAADLDVVVTLGGGLRKQWADVSLSDLVAMNDIRFQNYQQAEQAYMDFNKALVRIREVMMQHGTFGAVWEADGFPPEHGEAEARAS
jgi:hypothetical protein